MKFDYHSETFLPENSEEVLLAHRASLTYSSGPKSLLLCFKGDAIEWKFVGQQIVLFNHAVVRTFIGNGVAVNILCAEDCTISE